MTRKKNYQVISSFDRKNRVVWKYGAKRASKVFDTKTEAIEWGRHASPDSELVIHRENGTVERIEYYQAKSLPDLYHLSEPTSSFFVEY